MLFGSTPGGLNLLHLTVLFSTLQFYLKAAFQTPSLKLSKYQYLDEMGPFELPTSCRNLPARNLSGYRTNVQHRLSPPPRMPISSNIYRSKPLSGNTIQQFLGKDAVMDWRRWRKIQVIAVDLDFFPGAGHWMIRVPLDYCGY